MLYFKMTLAIKEDSAAWCPGRTVPFPSLIKTPYFLFQVHPSSSCGTCNFDQSISNFGISFAVGVQYILHTAKHTVHWIILPSWSCLTLHCRLIVSPPLSWVLSWSLHLCFFIIHPLLKSLVVHQFQLCSLCFLLCLHHWCCPQCPLFQFNRACKEELFHFYARRTGWWVNRKMLLWYNTICHLKF